MKLCYVAYTDTLFFLTLRGRELTGEMNRTTRTGGCFGLQPLLMEPSLSGMQQLAQEAAVKPMMRLSGPPHSSRGSGMDYDT